MALTYAEIDSVTREYILPGMRNEVYDIDPFLKLMKKSNKITADGGTKLQWTIRYQALGHGEAVDPDDQQTFRRKTTRAKAELEWMYYKTDTAISWPEKIKNRGKNEVVSLLEDRAKEMKEEGQNMIATAIWQLASAKSSLDMECLDTAVDSAATYGGIAVADAASWASTEDSSTTVLTLQALETNKNAATYAGRGPTHHFTTLNLMSKFHSLFDASKIYEDKKTANMGIENLSFYGKPVMGSNFCTTKYWYALDLDMYKIVCAEGEEWDLTPWMDLTPQGYINTYGAFLTFVGQLQVDMRRTSFKMSALVYNS